MIRLLQSSWFNALAGCLIYLGVTAALFRPADFQRARAILDNSIERSANDDPAWKFRNPEFEQWIAELHRERESLALRTQQLQELQTRLDAERKELTVVTQEVARLQAQFDRNVVRMADQETENLKRQGRVFAGMSPEAVATLLREMPEDEAARILFVMKPDEVSAILETLSSLGAPGAQRAAVITERTRRILPPDRSPPPGNLPK